MRPVNRGGKPQEANYENEYGYLRKALLARIGEYCSYCETPLGASLAVEHIIAKKNYDETDWDNLALACVNCNSRKSTQVNQENYDLFYLPTVAYDEPINTFDMLQYTLKAVTLGYLREQDLLRIPASRENATYLKDQTTYNMVWVFVNPAYAQEAIKIRNTINLCGLNDYIPEEFQQTMSDRRVENRTIAWSRAVDAANRLNKYFVPYNTQYTNAGNDVHLQQQAIANMNNDRGIPLLKKQIRYLAVATGFWSVWMTVFKDASRIFINDDIRKALIQELFGPQPQQFPGTNYHF